MTDRELMQQALGSLEYVIQSVGGNAPESFDVWFQKTQVPAEALRARLAQPEPEPVAWWDGVGRFATAKEKDWDRRTGGILSAGRDIPLYTAPPQREWKNLLEEDIDEVVNQTKGFGMNSHTFARAIEAKLKERNANE